jgi:hypothetical protein
MKAGGHLKMENTGLCHYQVKNLGMGTAVKLHPLII